MRKGWNVGLACLTILLLLSGCGAGGRRADPAAKEYAQEGGMSEEDAMALGDETEALGSVGGVPGSVTGTLENGAEVPGTNSTLGNGGGDIQGYKNGKEENQEMEAHGPAKEEQTVEDPVSGYCGNTVTTVWVGDAEYSFWGSDSVTLTDILINLAYEEGHTCRCPTEYTVDTEFGKGYGVNLTEYFARYGGGQAALTKEQAEIIEDIIDRVEKE